MFINALVYISIYEIQNGRFHKMKHGPENSRTSWYLLLFVDDGKLQLNPKNVWRNFEMSSLNGMRTWYGLCNENAFYCKANHSSDTQYKLVYEALRKEFTMILLIMNATNAGIVTVASLPGSDRRGLSEEIMTFSSPHMRYINSK